MNTTVNKIVFIVLLFSFSMNLMRTKSFSWLGLNDDAIEGVIKLVENESNGELTFEGIYDFNTIFEENMKYLFLSTKFFNSGRLLIYTEPHTESLFSPPEING